MVEYITADGLFSIDLALRPPPAQEQSTQPDAATADVRIHANGRGQSSDVGSGSSEGSTRVTAELAAGDELNRMQEHQVSGEAIRTDHACWTAAHNDLHEHPAATECACRQLHISSVPSVVYSSCSGLEAT